MYHFDCRLFGSHVTFVFNYGDGATEKKQGTELSHWNKDMTMFAEGIHSYTSGTIICDIERCNIDY